MADNHDVDYGCAQAPPRHCHKLLVKLYRQHVLNDDRFTSGDCSGDKNVRDTSKEQDDGCTLQEVSDSFTSLSVDALFAKPRDFGFQAGPVVASTRSPYERQLQQWLNNGSVPTTPSVPTNEFSATEEEGPQVIPEVNSDHKDGGLLQPILRSRAGTRGEDMAGHSAATTPAVGKQRRMYMAVKVLIVLVMITVNVLIYLRTPVEQGVLGGERDSEKISSAPNCVERNGEVKRNLEEPDLLPPKKKKLKVADSIEPNANLTSTVFVSLKVSVEPKDVVDMNDVAGFGAFQYNHVWMLTLHNAAAKEKLLHAAVLNVKGKTCLVIDPNCKKVGHMRKQCRTPWCRTCRTYGHEEDNCIQTYAAKTRPPTELQDVDNLMDQDEMEETIAATPTGKASELSTDVVGASDSAPPVSGVAEVKMTETPSPKTGENSQAGQVTPEPVEMKDEENRKASGADGTPDQEVTGVEVQIKWKGERSTEKIAARATAADQRFTLVTRKRWKKGTEPQVQPWLTERGASALEETAFED
ncbi:hypothetical protein HPB47_008580 [Ixodes persulcatus]|uniref:Uncharacterized protein n=1 Tax=Ixodes persulcatus TaxID=34615 RepID=A0AC60P496_IXOPE|nr:hypothetical protein HPB47_008580 [Ixodes persulcatus]